MVEMERVHSDINFEKIKLHDRLQSREADRLVNREIWGQIMQP